ncbi:PTH1 family peptidyl-tRNA hydrolase [Candidatus Kinetoplastibacterium blastocrithidii TCC012E]|uniref:Peptidyl-tRNA hydrolase n=1 Tax=Candidatus Kinetoplastidibacterium blastocrithidiae TCC012E TaxID=1208922 RepID=M1LAN4_9PROT|nr:aminoacyl-tRNA hydrolase [Candidatus Kinetoplastibacterium blastocrithidii]AFZ83452.1 peptidyl-tRNA hydrolase [Candidatus Kinetoplastibacterium blastocrithidii (ex Strigomonas culicis)]AGF49548.1 PTH1 family peptidyl-tRNA hydrolase [Candidatus Kinetoplastibacterium blastocrithidii TCC012E]
MINSKVFLLVGLGNPGERYIGTRHNIGFHTIDYVAEVFQVGFRYKDSFSGAIAQVKTSSCDLFLLKPTTYMNNSGISVASVLNFYKLAPEQLIVIHDELDILPGDIRLKQGGGFAGHNGLRSIQHSITTSSFWRIRVGIGHPRLLNSRQNVSDFVLNKPTCDEFCSISSAIERFRSSIDSLVKGDFEFLQKSLKI